MNIFNNISLGSGNEYGNRLNDIEKYPITEEVVSSIKTEISSFDKVFNVIDTVTDNMAFLSDKLVDTISNLIRKIFNRNEKGEISNEK